MNEEQYKEMMEMLGAIFVQLSRIYDATMFINSQEDIETLHAKHSSGELFGHPPILVQSYFEEESTGEDTE